MRHLTPWKFNCLMVPGKRCNQDLVRLWWILEICSVPGIKYAQCLWCFTRKLSTIWPRCLDERPLCCYAASGASDGGRLQDRGVGVPNGGQDWTCSKNIEVDWDRDQVTQLDIYTELHLTGPPSRFSTSQILMPWHACIATLCGEVEIPCSNHIPVPSSPGRSRLHETLAVVTIHFLVESMRFSGGECHLAVEFSWIFMNLYIVATSKSISTTARGFSDLRSFTPWTSQPSTWCLLSRCQWRVEKWFMASTSLQRSLPTLTLVMQHDQLYLTVTWEPKKVLLWFVFFLGVFNVYW